MARGSTPLDPTTRTSLTVLVIANLVAAVGVLAFGWDPYQLLVLYWSETFVIGLWTVPRILMAQASFGPTPNKLVLVPFFCVHFGVFMVAHLAFIHALTAASGAFSIVRSGVIPSASDSLSLPFDLTAVIAVIGFMVSHGVSFMLHYIGQGERLRTTPQMAMMRVYPRVIVMHLAILGGAFLMTLLAMSGGVLLILVIGKTLLDAKLHKRSHHRLTASR